MKRNIPYLSKMIAGCLAFSILLLSVGCDQKPKTEDSKSTDPVESTAVSTETTGDIPLQKIDNIEPEYRKGFLTENEIASSKELNKTIKTMINDDCYFGKNFDYLVERLTITNIYLKALGKASYSMNFNQDLDFASSQSTQVTLNYTADVVSKKTGEKSTTANTISYVVDDSKLYSMAQALPSKVNYQDLTSSVNTATTQKLKEMETTPDSLTSQDKVSGRQTNITNEYVKLFVTDEVLNRVYNMPEVKKYLDQGYTLTSTTYSYGRYNEHSGAPLVKGRFVKDFSLLEGAEYDFIIPQMSIRLITYTGDYNMQDLNPAFTLIMLAENPKTGDKRFLNINVSSGYNVDGEIIKQIENKLNKHSYVDIERLKKENTDFKGYDFRTAICMNEVFDEELFSLYQQLFATAVYDGGNIRFSYDKDLNDVTSFKDRMALKTLTESNANVIVKEPEASLEK